MNPYNSVGAGSVPSGSGSSATGRLKAGNLEQSLAHAAVPKEFLRDLKDTAKKIGVDWRNLNFFGPNNELVKELVYTVDMLSTSVARLVVASGEGPRFSIPVGLLKNDSGNPTGRMELMGLSLNRPQESFGIRMVDVLDPTSEILTSVGQTLLFADKYIQMDFQLPTTRVYGLGDRVHQFRLDEGAFTMWASG